MTNFEKYRNLLIEIRNMRDAHGIAIVDNQPVACFGQCYNCDLRSSENDCSDALIEWLFNWSSEYIE